MTLEWLLDTNQDTKITAFPLPVTGNENFKTYNSITNHQEFRNKSNKGCSPSLPKYL